MIQTIARAWRIRQYRAEITSLTNRLGSHIARDIGIENIAMFGCLRPSGSND